MPTCIPNLFWWYNSLFVWNNKLIFHLLLLFNHRKSFFKHNLIYGISKFSLHCCYYYFYDLEFVYSLVDVILGCSSTLVLPFEFVQKRKRNNNYISYVSFFSFSFFPYTSLNSSFLYIFLTVLNVDILLIFTSPIFSLQYWIWSRVPPHPSNIGSQF